MMMHRSHFMKRLRLRLSASSDAASPAAPPRSPPWRQRRSATTTRHPATTVRFGKLGKEARAPITARSSLTSPANAATSPTHQLWLRRKLWHSLWTKEGRRVWPTPVPPSRRLSRPSLPHRLLRVKTPLPTILYRRVSSSTPARRPPCSLQLCHVTNARLRLYAYLLQMGRRYTRPIAASSLYPRSRVCHCI
jgi:hypothetical protein